jgi:undecaprenyl-diphosphatase
MKQRKHEAFDYLMVLKNPSMIVRSHTSPSKPRGKGAIAHFAIASEGRIGEKNPAFPAEWTVNMSDAIRAVILGIIEGVTEFLPVSSTGHLLLAERFFGLGEGAFWDSFTVLIQLGAILAIVVLYFKKLWDVAIGMFTGDAYARRFVIGVLVAFLPAVVVGLIAGKYIKSLLFNPWVVCFSLIVGGAILLWVDRLELKAREHDATRFPLLMYLYIGIAQCVAMIPGVSRSGASIVAAMFLGADKRAAAEFSFFLAIPTMIGAFVYDFYKNRSEMTMDHMGIVAIGFVVSFVTAIIVVKTFLDYVTRHGFVLFAWWRVVVGTLGLIALALGR